MSAAPILLIMLTMWVIIMVNAFNQPSIDQLLSERPPRAVDWDREEHESCQANTPGCCIDHNRDHGSCECW